MRTHLFTKLGNPILQYVAYDTFDISAPLLHSAIDQ